MCLAIARRVLVKLAYQGDSNERLFEPIAVYISREEKACVSGVEIANPDKALAKPEPRAAASAPQSLPVKTKPRGRSAVLRETVLIASPPVSGTRCDGPLAQPITGSISGGIIVRLVEKRPKEVPMLAEEKTMIVRGHVVLALKSIVGGVTWQIWGPHVRRTRLDRVIVERSRTSIGRRHINMGWHARMDTRERWMTHGGRGNPDRWRTT
jgi:hypothetical protein